jgi:hypothetical protein
MLAEKSFGQFMVFGKKLGVKILLLRKTLGAEFLLSGKENM